MAIGRPNLRKDVFPPLWLDSYWASHALAACSRHTDPCGKLCLSNGMELVWPDRSAQRSKNAPKLSQFYAGPNRRVYGCVVDLLRSDSMNASSPMMVTAAVRQSFAYWATIEQPKSWTYARFVAFSANASTAKPQSIAIGDPITGVVTNTSSKYTTAHLIGWKVEGQPATKL